MNNINEILSKLEMAQICWVVPDIRKTVQFLSSSLGVSFPEPEHSSARDFNMSFNGKVTSADWLTTQTYNGGSYIELVQPLSGESMFHDYLQKFPAGGIQHIAFRLPVEDFEQVTNTLREQGFACIGEVDHQIARMAFFDTYGIAGVATEIMGITPEGWKILEKMEMKHQK